MVLDTLVHPALLYATEREYLAALVPFITTGLNRGEPVAVAVPGARLRVLRAALGAAADAVTLVDMAVAGRNPGRIIATVLREFADRHRGRHVRMVGEHVWAGRTDVEYPACMQHEALVNKAFADRDVTILCPYETTGLDDRALADAYATHPVVWAGDERQPSDRYAPDAVFARYNEPLRDGGSDAFVVTTITQVAAARWFATGRARGHGLTAERVADLQIVVTELVTNSMVHTNDSCDLRVWVADGHLVCEVRDNGHLTDPLAGRRPAEEDQRGGRGLLMVHALADLVRTHTTPAGTTMRVFLRLPGRH